MFGWLVHGQSVACWVAWLFSWLVGNLLVDWLFALISPLVSCLIGSVMRCLMADWLLSGYRLADWLVDG